MAVFPFSVFRFPTMEAGKPDGGEGANPGGEAENGEAKAKPEAKEMAPDVGRIAAFRAGLASPEPKKARVDPTGAVRAAGDPGRRTKITGTSPVWSILDVGFSKYHEKSLDEYVVCNTCVASGQFAHAEFKYGSGSGRRHPCRRWQRQLARLAGLWASTEALE